MARRRLRLISHVRKLVPLACFATTQAAAEDTPPPPTEPPAIEAPTSAASGPPPEPDEVLVRGMRKPDATTPKDSLTGREIRQTPGAFGDAFRAIDSLPGVTPIASGVPYFFVRGAPPGNTGFFIDGVRVPGLFHLGIGPAVMYPALIDHVDLYKGAYPASYGRFAGGILSAETVRPGERTRADWTLRLFDAGALVEAPFDRPSEQEAPKGSALVSGRYGYPGLLLSVFAPDAGLAYWDYQSRVSYRVSDRDTLSVFGFGSYDSVSQRQKDAEGVPDEHLTELLNIQFHRLDLRWDRRMSATGALRAAVTFGYDRTASEGFAARSYIFGTRVNAEERLGKAARLRAGADTWAQSYDFRLGRSEPASDIGATDSREMDAGELTDVNLAAWLELPLDLAPRVEVTPALRADVFTSRGPEEARAIPSLDPRVTARIGAGPFDYVTGVGIAHQPAAFPLPIPALTFAQLRRGLQSGYHMSQGVELALPGDFTASALGYLHMYRGLVDLSQPCDPDDPRCDRALSAGRSVGGEFLLKRKVGHRLSGWISYTLSRSTRGAYDALQRRFRTVLSQFDRPHVLNVVLSLDLGKGWRTGGRYTGYSGVPYSTFSEAAPPNARMPSFHRVDLRVEKRWVHEGGRSFALTAEMFNALLSKEAIGMTCPGYPQPCRPEEIGPISIPSLGFEGTL